MAHQTDSRNGKCPEFNSWQKSTEVSEVQTFQHSSLVSLTRRFYSPLSSPLSTLVPSPSLAALVGLPFLLSPLPRASVRVRKRRAEQAAPCQPVAHVRPDTANKRAPVAGRGRAFSAVASHTRPDISVSLAMPSGDQFISCPQRPGPGLCPLSYSARL